MKLVFLTCVFVAGVYFGLRAERGGELEEAIDAIASVVDFVVEQAQAWQHRS